MGEKSLNERLKEIADHLRHVPMLASVPPDYLLAVAAAVQPVSLRQHEVLFFEGDFGDSLAVVTKGKLSVRRKANPEPIEVGTVYPGEVVGEMSCIDPYPRIASVVSTTDSDVLVLSRNAFDAMAAQSKTLAVALRGAILQVLTQRLRETNARIEAALSAQGIELDPADTVTSELPIPIEVLPGPIDLTQVSCLKEFTVKELQALVEVAPPKTYPAGFVLCVEGKPGDSCFIIARGQVDVSRRVRGEEQHLAVLQGGSMIGQLALIDGAPRTARVTALTPLVALRLSSGNFDKLLRAKSEFGIRFQAQLAVAGVRQLRSATEQLTHLLEMDLAATVEPMKAAELSRVQAGIEQWDMELEALFDKAEA
jgi:CRP-like cAMP-binding protein